MNFIPSLAGFPTRKSDDDDRSTSSDGTVEEPTETEQRYAALRNHQIRFADAIDPNAERVYKLRKKDIVFGRGRGFQNHPGNERMRDIIEKYKTQYHSLNRDGKRKLVEAVYEEITQSGARFLKKLDGENVWVVVDLPIALQKVSHTMRCRKSIIRQLDENGHVPALSLSTHAIRAAVMPGSAAMPGMAGVIPGMGAAGALPGMGAAGALPGMGAAGALPGMGAAGALPGMGAGIPGMSAMSPTAMGLPGAAGAAGMSALGAAGMYPPGAAAAAAGGGATDSSLAALEAQRMAALHRYRVLSGMAVARQGDIEYYQQLRREQLLRETRMLQQMGDAALLGGPSTPGAAGGVVPATAVSASGIGVASAVPSAALGVPGPGASHGIGLAPGAGLPASMLSQGAHLSGFDGLPAGMPMPAPEGILKNPPPEQDE